MRLILLISLLFFGSCAQMFPPNGGDEDVLPPEITKDGAIPENKTIHFNSKTIVLTFNEFIKLNNPAENIIISPTMAEKPEFILKGKKLQINLKSELKQNTTYTINFGNAISDITENNVAAGLSYVFSTGDVLDSLKISGTVTNAYTNAGEKGVWVLLHRNLSDTAFQKCFPDYLAKTDANGNYVLQNLSAGEYKIYALKDGNSDYKFSQSIEEIAFSNDTVSLVQKNEFLNLRMFNESSERQYVKSSKFFWPGRMQMVMNKPYAYWNASVLPYDTITKSMYMSVYKNSNGDTIDVWLKKPAMENGSEIKVVLPIEKSDSLNKKSDTVTFRVSGVKDQIPAIKIKTNASNNFGLYDALKIKYDRPAMLLNKSKIHLFKNDSIEIDAETKILGYGTSLINNWEPKTDYKIILEDSAFAELFYGKYSRADTISFTTVKKDYYGNIITNLSAPNKNYILEITGTHDKLIFRKEINGENKFIAEHIPPGNYKVKLIEDTDGNGKWSTGILNENKQPERIFYYKENIVIRSNWDYELNWKIEN